MFPEAKLRETLGSRGRKAHCFPRHLSLSVLLYLPAKKIEKTVKKSLLDKIAKLPQFQGARPGHVRVESCCSQGS